MKQARRFGRWQKRAVSVGVCIPVPPLCLTPDDHHCLSDDMPEVKCCTPRKQHSLNIRKPQAFSRTVFLVVAK